MRSKIRIILIVGFCSLLLVSIIAVATYSQEDNGRPPTVDSSATDSGTSTADSTQTVILSSSSLAQLESVSPCNCTLVIPPLTVFPTLSDLESGSLLVVEANVTSTLTIGIPQNTEGSADPSTASLPVTYYNISVIQTLDNNGRIDTSGAVSLSVVQIGGTAGGTKMMIGGYPSLEVGQTYIMFLTFPGTYLVADYGYLTANHPSVPPSFITTGGAQGLFYLHNGSVYSLNNEYPQTDSWLQVKVSGISLSQFVAQVESAVNTTNTTTSAANSIG